MDRRVLLKGDVVQVSPELVSTGFAGCFAQVMKCEDRGLHLLVMVPDIQQQFSSHVSIALPWSSVEYVGRGPWTVDL